MAFYACIALGPIPMYYYVRSESSLPEDSWKGTTAFDNYFGPGLLYHGGAAVSAYLLSRRRASAVWPSRLVLAFATLSVLSKLWHTWLRDADFDYPAVTVSVSLAAFLLATLRIERLRRVGALNAAPHPGGPDGTGRPHA